MPETDYASLEGKTPADRTVMHVLYGMHTVAPFTVWVLSVIALIVHYVKRADETDVLYVSHHNYMIRTVWWTALWLWRHRKAAAPIPKGASGWSATPAATAARRSPTCISTSSVARAPGARDEGLPQGLN